MRRVDVALLPATFGFYRASAPWHVARQLGAGSRAGSGTGNNRRCIGWRRATQFRERREWPISWQTEIIEKIKAHAEPDGKEITLDTELDELGIHSLELTEIMFDLEEAYGIEIEMNTVEAWSNLKNVGDIVEATRALIAAKGLN